MELFKAIQIAEGDIECTKQQWVEATEKPKYAELYKLARARWLHS